MRFEFKIEVFNGIEKYRFNVNVNAMVGVALSVALCSIEMIMKGAYEPVTQKKNVVMVIIMIVLAIPLVERTINVVKTGAIIDGKIVTDVGFIVLYVSLEIVATIYWIKRFDEKSQVEE